MDEYVSLVKTFNSKGHITFMNQSYSGNDEDGQGETLYMHVLRYYAPRIIRHTYETHAVGPGVFTMEGFEYINYVSKNGSSDASKQKGNITAQALPVLAMMYIHHEHDIKAVLKRQHQRSQCRQQVTESQTNNEQDKSSEAEETVQLVAV